MIILTCFFLVNHVTILNLKFCLEFSKIKTTGNIMSPLNCNKTLKEWKILVNQNNMILSKHNKCAETKRMTTKFYIILFAG